MKTVQLSSKFEISDDVVAREIEGELIIVPLIAGIGDLENELFTLNETGKAIWQKLDGNNSVKAIITHLAQEYVAESEEIRRDVIGLVSELARRGMVVEVEKV